MMLRSLKELYGYTMGAKDGDIGGIRDFYFDDDAWAIRYLVIDTGTWLPGREVLVSPIPLGKAEWRERRLSVDLTRDQIKQAPAIDTDRPISRQHEAGYADYYGWPYYWHGGGIWGTWAYPGALVRPPAEPVIERPAEEADPHLRSMREVMGYHIRATDGEIGHAEDLIVDDETWQVRYLVIDTKNWWLGKRVLVSPNWINRVSWDERMVEVELPRDRIKNAPEWDPTEPVNREYEEQLYDFYGRPVYW